VATFASGFLAYVWVRQAVYSELGWPDGAAGKTGALQFVLDSNVLQATSFVLFILVPALVALGNALADDGLGFTLSSEDHLRYTRILLPVWGALLLVTAPIQWLAPQFVVVGPVGISIGLLSLGLLGTICTIYAIRHAGYLSLFQAAGAFSLSLFTLPLLPALNASDILTGFLLAAAAAWYGSRLLRRIARHREARRGVAALLPMLRSDPGNADAGLRIARLHFENENRDAARLYLEEAAGIAPRRADIRFLLGRIHAETGSWREALTILREAYAVDPELENGKILRELGKAEIQLEDAATGRRRLQQYLEGHPGDLEARYWLARSLGTSGDNNGMRLQLHLLREQARAASSQSRKLQRRWLLLARSLRHEEGGRPASPH